jgi:hypothetical protein
MDYLNGLTNDDLIAYFLVDLHSRKELMQYTYPHEFLEPQDAIDEHVIRCQNILWDYLFEKINEYSFESGLHLSKSEIYDIVNQKKMELHRLFEPLVMKYLEDVKINYIDLRG